MGHKKSVLITGGSAGIGKATALELARNGYRVFITGRSEEKTKLVAEELKRISGNTEVDYFIADLSLMSEVRKMAAEINSRIDRLDVLVNNAGGVNQKRELTAEGIERTFATNHLSYFLLTHLLLDMLKGSTPARIVNVSSNSHYPGFVDFDNLQLESGYYIMKAYSNSKLCNVLFTYQLARKLQGMGITVNALHPGVVDTRIGQKNTSMLSSAAWKLITLVKGISVEKGARTSVYLASSPEVENISGKYFVNCRERQSSRQSYDEAVAEKLWKISAGLTGLENA